MSKRKYSKEEFVIAVNSSISIAEVLKKLNLKPAGGNYLVAKQMIKELQLDTSHLKGQSHNKGKNFGPKRPVEDYLTENSRVLSHSLKLKLLRAGLFSHKCYNCNLTTWLDKPIPLELEHINGNHSDNRLENLTLLCPNCHALTPTYRGKNKKRNP